MVAAFLISITAATVITWIIARHYYQKSYKDQIQLFDKLPSQIIEPILKDSRDKITVLELNKLLAVKTIDRNSKHPLPFKACPNCGSGNIEFGTDHIVDGDSGDNGEPVFYATPYSTIKCNECGWDTDEINEFGRKEK